MAGPAVGGARAAPAATGIAADAATVQRVLRQHALRTLDGQTLSLDALRGEVVARELGLQHLPFTIVLDRDGQVAFTTRGASEDAVAGLVQRTQQLVAAKPQ